MKVADFIFGSSSFINTGALLSDWYRTKVVFQHMVWSPDHCHVTVTLVELMISTATVCVILVEFRISTRTSVGAV